MKPVRLHVPASTRRILAAGHPWVFHDGADLPVGGLVELVDGRDRPVAWGVGDTGEIAVRVLGLGRAPRRPLATVIAERVAAADALRPRLLPAQTDAYRVVNGPGDGLPGLVVDRYAHLAVVRLYAAAWQPHLPAIVAACTACPWASAVARRLGVGRVDGRRGLERLHGGDPSTPLVVHEAGMRLLVRPKEGQKTGMFLDQREHRTWIRRLASGLDVANLFGYNGAFSVAAALGGAARVVTVDIAAAALDDARENFRLNGLDPAGHGFEATDAFTWRPPQPVGLMILDPPSLSHGRHSDGAALQAYRKLHRHHGPAVARGGLLATSSCSARQGLADWRQAIREGLTPGVWSWLWTSAQPPDHPVALGHPEGDYLKFALLARR